MAGLSGVNESNDAFKNAGNVIMEAVTNVRTVFSFGNEEIIINVI